jgi:hypothetical protein
VKSWHYNQKLWSFWPNSLNSPWAISHINAELKNQCFKPPVLPHHHSWQISGETVGFRNVASNTTQIWPLAWEQFREETKTATTKLVVHFKHHRYCQINDCCEQKSIFSSFLEDTKTINPTYILFKNTTTLQLWPELHGRF